MASVDRGIVLWCCYLRVGHRGDHDLYAGVGSGNRYATRAGCHYQLGMKCELDVSTDVYIV